MDSATILFRIRIISVYEGNKMWKHFQDLMTFLGFSDLVKSTTGEVLGYYKGLEVLVLRDIRV